MDPVEVLWLLAQQPLWLGYTLLGGGLFSLGLICGVWLQ
jgi:hypothetical protein